MTTSVDPHVAVVRDTPAWEQPAVPLKIESPEQYEAAADALKKAKSFITRVKDFFNPHKRRLDEAKRGLLDSEKEALRPAEEFERQVKRALADFDAEQERLRQEEQRRLEAEARKQEEARRLEEAAALEAEALAEGDESKLAEAQQLIADPVETPVVVVEKQTPRVEGLSYRESWDAKVTDLSALIRFVAANPAYENLLTPNQIALRAQARSLKGSLAIPGVKAYSTRVVAQR